MVRTDSQDQIKRGNYMKLINEKDFKNNNYEYIWYACYGSNINYKRFMMYINGGKHASKTGCNDKSEPLEYRSYIIEHPIYFAGESKNWTGGMAFLDYKSTGKTYGKIYKIKKEQFKDIFEQENELYDTIILLGYIDKLPILTFTAKNKLNKLLNNPSINYKDIIIEGLRDLKVNLTEKELNSYLSN